jgi:probable F420-dependent oxidoreductase
MMRIGVVFPQTEMPADPLAIRDYAQAAEALGYTHILAYDHVLGANPERSGGWHGPYTYQDSFFEPFVLFSYLAGITESVELVSGVFILPQRETALFAKQAATLDVLCHGRLRLGIGTGWNVVEYEALNQDFHTRGRRQEEQVTLLRLLWTEDLVTFEGEWHSIPDAGLNPLPRQRPIPIWFGGHADAVLQRVAKVGDGWLPNYRSAAGAAPSLDLLDRYLAENGRSRADLGLEPRISWHTGDLEKLMRQKEEWQSAGATHLSLNTMYAGFTTTKQHIDALRAFADAVQL